MFKNFNNYIVALWSNWNKSEICPLPLSPATWSFFSDLFAPEIMKTLFSVIFSNAVRDGV
ncbi:MAG: hypothetical protein A2Y62_14565 [Candidatus Fischerbacteria bacterium RBG_13_37_8]|uniref:Uncharacterized protein n=1 Tax=Candidatus Fischerbacteria bacterium RBG_13_37_8 TaxID=1817863 RepID=A0A1F5V5E3_9BACT|nr:MAG: hypothetical protein A2Y62_14565 [Candidatus Fischerbacteria bacterium RBG_13_37_8]